MRGAYEGALPGITSRVALLAGLVAAAVLAAVVYFGGFYQHPKVPSSGPLFDPTYEASSIGFAVTPGTVFTFGYSMLTNSGATPAVLRSIHLRNATLGFKLVASCIASADHRSEIPANTRTFKRKPFYEPAAGSTLAPGQAYVLVLELEINGDGSFTSGGTLVDYTVGGDRYELWVPDLIRICAPVSIVDCRTQPLPTPTG